MKAGLFLLRPLELFIEAVLLEAAEFALPHQSRALRPYPILKLRELPATRVALRTGRVQGLEISRSGGDPGVEPVDAGIELGELPSCPLCRLPACLEPLAQQLTLAQCLEFACELTRACDELLALASQSGDGAVAPRELGLEFANALLHACTVFLSVPLLFETTELVPRMREFAGGRAASVIEIAHLGAQRLLLLREFGPAACALGFALAQFRELQFAFLALGGACIQRMLFRRARLFEFRALLPETGALLHELIPCLHERRALALQGLDALALGEALGRRARASGAAHEAVPSPQPAIPAHKRLSRRKAVLHPFRALRLDHPDTGKQPGQTGRILDGMEKRLHPRRPAHGLWTALAILAPEGRCVGARRREQLLAQKCGKRPVVAGCYADAAHEGPFRDLRQQFPARPDLGIERVDPALEVCEPGAAARKRAAHLFQARIQFPQACGVLFHLLLEFAQPPLDGLRAFSVLLAELHLPPAALLEAAGELPRQSVESGKALLEMADASRALLETHPARETRGANGLRVSARGFELPRAFRPSGFRRSQPLGQITFRAGDPLALGQEFAPSSLELCRRVAVLRGRLRRFARKLLPARGEQLPFGLEPLEGDPRRLPFSPRPFTGGAGFGKRLRERAKPQLRRLPLLLPPPFVLFEIPSPPGELLALSLQGLEAGPVRLPSVLELLPSLGSEPQLLLAAKLRLPGGTFALLETGAFGLDVASLACEHSCPGVQLLMPLLELPEADLRCGGRSCARIALPLLHLESRGRMPEFEQAGDPGEAAGLFLDAPIALRLARLTGKAVALRAEDLEPLAQALEIAFGLSQASLGLSVPSEEPTDPGRRLEQTAPLLGAPIDDGGDFPLADEGRAAGAAARVGEEEMNVARADLAAADRKAGATATLEPAADEQRLPACGVPCDRPLEKQRNLGDVARRPGRGAAEQHVLHLPAAQAPGRAFARDPAQRIEDVRFAAAVGADDAREPVADGQRDRVGEGFEPGDPKFEEFQCATGGC